MVRSRRLTPLVCSFRRNMDEFGPTDPTPGQKNAPAKTDFFITDGSVGIPIMARGKLCTRNPFLCVVSYTVALSPGAAFTRLRRLRRASYHLSNRKLFALGFVLKWLINETHF